jgi:hypothetical protein
MYLSEAISLVVLRQVNELLQNQNIIEFQLGQK